MKAQHLCDWGFCWLVNKESSNRPVDPNQEAELTRFVKQVLSAKNLAIPHLVLSCQWFEWRTWKRVLDITGGQTEELCIELKKEGQIQVGSQKYLSPNILRWGSLLELHRHRPQITLFRASFQNWQIFQGDKFGRQGLSAKSSPEWRS